MQFNLSKLIKTKYDIDILTKELSILEGSLYKHGDDGFDSVLKSSVRNWVAEIIKVETENKDKEQYLKTLKKEILTLPEVKLIIAFEPPITFISKVYDLIQNSMKEKIVLDIIFDRQVIGGAIIIYRGKYIDFSFRRVFNSELDKTRDEILDILNKKMIKN